MKTIIINASPKSKNSNTENFLKHLISRLPEKETKVYKLNELKTEEIQNCSSLVFAFPLYVDSLPSELLKFLCLLEKVKFENKDIMIFAVVNNGFFEGEQNHIALDIIKNWCNKVGLKWGQGIGIGAGEMSPAVANIPLKKSPFALLDSAFDGLACNIENHISAENIYISPKMPRFLWKIGGTYTFWPQKAKKNGLKARDIFHQS